MDERLQVNHRPLGYEPSTLSLIWRNLTPVWAEKTLPIGPNFGPKKSTADKEQATRIPRAPDGRWKKKHRAVLSISILAGKITFETSLPRQAEYCQGQTHQPYDLHRTLRQQQPRM